MRAFVVVSSVLSISAEICDETVLLQVGSSLKQDPQVVHAHLQGDSPLPDGEGQLKIDAWLDIHHIPGNSDDDSVDDQRAALSVGDHREHDVYEDDHDADDHDDYHEVHDAHGELDSDFWLGEDDLTIEEPQKEAVREAFKAVDEVAVKENFPPKEMEEELFDVNLQTVPLAAGLEAVEEHFEEAFEKLQPFHSNEELDAIEEEFFKKVEPHFQELECDDWDHDCKLPPMSENRCIRQCAWEHYDDNSDSSALEINAMCLKVCECEVDQCDDKLAGYDVGELFHDHHAAMKTGNWDFDWEHSNSVKGDTGFNDCARRQCNHMWSERHSMHCGIDWAAGNPWKKIQIHNEDGSLKEIRGIPVTDDVVDENAPRSCDEKCEACGKCENRCIVESEDYCGTNELRAESCANAEWASDWCYKDFWSCKWETGPESCHCWNMDDAQMHSYDTCAKNTISDDDSDHFYDSISTTGEANISTSGSDYGYYEEFPFLKQQMQSRPAAHNNFLIQQGVAQRSPILRAKTSQQFPSLPPLPQGNFMSQPQQTLAPLRNIGDGNLGDMIISQGAHKLPFLDNKLSLDKEAIKNAIFDELPDHFAQGAHNGDGNLGDMIISGGAHKLPFDDNLSLDKEAIKNAIFDVLPDNFAQGAHKLPFLGNKLSLDKEAIKNAIFDELPDHFAQ